ncbi:MAG: hypothetical protein G01um101419_527 [Parcubacteria group bacterium Gr01-1014_19]|nr:MAG: hypothetical protein G01um101419_527 [Parcubacteria group bacterium Gr01-1014_19]
MLATTKAPPLSKRQVELINKIWKELEGVFGAKEGSSPECLRRHITYADGITKREMDLVITLSNLRKDPPEPEILLPEGTDDGEQPWPDHQ